MTGSAKMTDATAGDGRSKFDAFTFLARFAPLIFSPLA